MIRSQRLLYRPPLSDIHDGNGILLRAILYKFLKMVRLDVRFHCSRILKPFVKHKLACVFRITMQGIADASWFRASWFDQSRKLLFKFLLTPRNGFYVNI